MGIVCIRYIPMALRIKLSLHVYYFVAGVCGHKIVAITSIRVYIYIVKYIYISVDIGGVYGWVTIWYANRSGVSQDRCV